MSYASHLQCTRCATRYPLDSPMNLCPEDNRPVEIIIDTSRLRDELPALGWYHPEIASMWRFGALLPLDIGHADERQAIVTAGEGHTPLLSLASHPLARRHAIELRLKDEGQPHAGFGANPTGSFKDRGMSMVASQARRLGIGKLVVPTQGNAGDSLADYALRAQIEVAVIMPDDTPMPILGRVAALARQHPGVTLELVSGTIREAAELMREKYLPMGYFNVATFQEPGWRIEGKKTLGLELAEPAPGDDGPWSLPDAVLYPTGGGTGILGMWKAFDELQALGLIGSERPRMIAVQSEQTAPVADAFIRGTDEPWPVTPGATLATGLNVPGGVGHPRVLEIVRQSGGGAVAVSEKDIATNLQTVYRDHGIWICPEGAAAVAAITPAAEQGWINSGDTVVAFNTGSFEKYLPEVRHLIFGL